MITKILFFIAFSTIAVARVSFLVVGDTGYNPKFQFHDIPYGKTLNEFKNKFHAPLIRNRESPGFWVEKSGASYVGRAMADICMNNYQNCNFALVTGDLIYPYGFELDNKDDERFKVCVLEPFESLTNIANFKFYPVLGNHEWYAANADKTQNLDEKIHNSNESVKKLIRYLARGDNKWFFNGKTDDERKSTWYSFKEGNSEFFALDTTKIINAVDRERAFKQSKYPVKDVPFDLEEGVNKQIRWLENGIRNSPAKWKIVFSHHPLESITSRVKEVRIIQEKLKNIVCNHASLYIAGHDHTLQVLNVPCGPSLPPIPLVLSGAGSKMDEFSGAASIPNENIIFKKDKTWGFAHLTLNSEKAYISILTVDGVGKSSKVFNWTIKNRLNLRKIRQ